MWKAKLLDLRKNREQLTVVVEYARGSEDFTEEYVINVNRDKKWVKERVVRRIKELSQLDEFINTEKFNVGKEIVADQPIQPNPKDIKKEKLTRLMGKYSEKKSLVNMDLFTETELGLTAIKQQIKILYNELNS